MTNDEINTHLALKTADLLAEWAGLPLGAKMKIGNGRDPNEGLAMCMMMLAGQVQDANITPDTRDKLAAQVLTCLAGKTDGAYISYGTDYGPDRGLSDLGKACGIDPRAWPNKSMMNVTKVYGDGSGSNSVTVSTGYHGRHITHYLTDDGWLVAGVNVPRQLHAVVRAACERGDLSRDVAEWVPFDPSTKPRT